MSKQLIDRIFGIVSPDEFNQLAIEIFRFQAVNNPVYRDYLSYLGINPGSVTDIYDIPFLPIGFFRRHEVVTGNKVAEVVFSSSGTTAMEASRHFVSVKSVYEQSFVKCFKLFYGNPSDYTILALLPSYLEREGSSLVYMMEHLIKLSANENSGFYLRNYEELLSAISLIKKKKGKILLVGVTYALLEVAEKYSPDLGSAIVVETGGMKGMRSEMIREELHKVLKGKLNIPVVHSEYGMTELLSQAYSSGSGLFRSPPWMSVIMRDPNDPLSNFRRGKQSGGINIIDLANINSCSFIATDDLGRVYPDGSFEVTGRFDNSDIRGCNLLV